MLFFLFSQRVLGYEGLGSNEMKTERQLLKGGRQKRRETEKNCMKVDFNTAAMSTQVQTHRKTILQNCQQVENVGCTEIDKW